MNTSESEETVGNNIEANLASALTTFLSEREVRLELADGSFLQESQSQCTAQLSSWAAAHGYDQDDPDLTSIRHSLELRRARTATIESLPETSFEQKIQLRDILGYDNWPTHFQTYDNLHTPRSDMVGSSSDVWSQTDEHALELIMNYSSVEIGVIASTFFPERFANDVYLKADEILGSNGGQDQRDDEEPLGPMTWARLQGTLGVVAAVEQ
ncbi:hypothetical protein EKO04_011119 [Ascochyta lentis]|uniref:Uncharacterized protein n=1 Tax=Ascochyta lentis TaxID=205686 RepID=A0A8H7IUC6_9PLEO|nr:hypothetical protein EKO04_011119 [Ascochyta lentis]